MPLISQCQFAKDNGVSRQAISKAIRLKRLPSEGGKVDPAIAQPVWDRIKDPAQAGRKHSPRAPRMRSPKGPVVPLAPSDSRRSGSLEPTRSFDDAKMQAAYLRVAREEIQLKRMREELVEAADMRRHTSGFVLNSRAKLLSLGHRLAGKLAIESDKAKCRELIDEAVRELLTDLANYESVMP